MNTLLKRPDLLEEVELSDEDRDILRKLELSDKDKKF